MQWEINVLVGIAIHDLRRQGIQEISFEKFETQRWEYRLWRGLCKNKT
jgi:hypothetical protein